MSMGLRYSNLLPIILLLTSACDAQQVSNGKSGSVQIS